MSKSETLTLDTVRAVIVTTRNKMIREGILDPSFRLEARFSKSGWQQIQDDLNNKDRLSPVELEFKTQSTMFGVKLVESLSLINPGFVIVDTIYNNPTGLAGNPDYIRG